MWKDFYAAFIMERRKPWAHFSSYRYFHSPNKYFLTLPIQLSTIKMRIRAKCNTKPRAKYIYILKLSPVSPSHCHLSSILFHLTSSPHHHHLTSYTYDPSSLIAFFYSSWLRSQVRTSSAKTCWSDDMISVVVLQWHTYFYNMFLWFPTSKTGRNLISLFDLSSTMGFVTTTITQKLPIPSLHPHPSLSEPHLFPKSCFLASPANGVR